MRHPASRTFLGRRLARAATRALCVGGVAAALAGAGGGCVEQELHVDTNPDGALVFMNDQEVGRTPIRRPFTWYGIYDVVLRKEGYETVRVKTPVVAPPWLWVPFDFVLQVLPFRFTDTHRLKYELKPESEATVDPDLLIQNGRAFQRELESGMRTVTKPRTTAPATTRPAKGAATTATAPNTGS
jgi:hypothetical protein